MMSSRWKWNEIVETCCFNFKFSYLLIKFDVPTKETISIDQEIRKDEDFLRSCITKLKEYEEDYKNECYCKEQGEFVKYGFDFRYPKKTKLTRLFYNF